LLFLIGSMTSVDRAICIAEGFATGATIYEAIGCPVAVAFNAGNLGPVARVLREEYPDLTLIVCADDDYRTEGNPGLTKAKEAAAAVGGRLAIPDFGDPRPDGATDFNDMGIARGHEAVRHALASAIEPSNGFAATIKDSSTKGSTNIYWSDPLALVVTLKATPYPISALPPTIRGECPLRCWN
jgi:putative DNA primase/helicase